jgi:hypothetical protein
MTTRRATRSDSESYRSVVNKVGTRRVTHQHDAIACGEPKVGPSGACHPLQAPNHICRCIFDGSVSAWVVASVGWVMGSVGWVMGSVGWVVRSEIMAS